MSVFLGMICLVLLTITTGALTLAISSIFRLFKAVYEHISTFRFERECIFGIFVMIDFIWYRWELFG